MLYKICNVLQSWWIAALTDLFQPIRSTSISKQNKKAITKWTNSLVFHAREDDIEHLCERGLSSGLVDEVAAGQVDVIAGPDGQEHRALVNLYVRRGHRRQQRLEEEEVNSYQTGCPVGRLQLLLHLLNHQ